MSDQEPSRDSIAFYRSLLNGEVKGSESVLAAQRLVQSLVETIATPIFIKDRDSRFLACNQAFADYAGLTADEIVGKTDADLPWGGEGTTDFTIWDRRVMSSGVPKTGIIEPLRLADGRTRHLETNKVPFRDTNGEILGILGSFRDVTDRWEAEERLHNTLESLDRQVQDQTPELVEANRVLAAEAAKRLELQFHERQQREQMEVLRDIASAISTTLEIEAVLDEVFSGIHRLMQVDLIAAVLVGKDGQHNLERIECSNDYEITAIDDGGLDFTWVEPLLRPDVRNGMTVAGGPGRRFGNAASSVAAVMVVGGEVIGFIITESSGASLRSGKSAARLGSVAAQAAATISTIRLSSAATDRAAEDERRWLSGALHDSAMQSLWSAAVMIDAAEESSEPTVERELLPRIGSAVDAARDSLRSLVLNMRPEELERLSLVQLLQDAVSSFSARDDADVSVRLDPVRLEPHQEQLFYRIAQEALTNINRHASASKVAVTLRADPEISLSIEDDGRGFDPGSAGAGRLGLQLMSQRAASAQATITITSRPGAGTVVRVAEMPAVERSLDLTKGPAASLRSASDSGDDGRISASRPRPMPRSRRILIALLTVFSLLAGITSALAFRGSGAAQQQAAELSIELDRAAVMEQRIILVRGQLDELTLAMATPFQPELRDDLLRASALNTILSRNAIQALDSLADLDGAGGDEARRIQDVLDDIGSDIDQPRSPDNLLAMAEALQFNGTIPPASPVGKIDSLGDLVWFDQPALFVLQESLITRYAQNPNQAEGTPEEMAEFLTFSAPSIREFGGYLGPRPDNPLTDGYVPTETAAAQYPDVIEQVSDVVRRVDLWEEDQWIRSWTAGETGPEELPPSLTPVLTDKSLRAVTEIRRIVDQSFDDFQQDTAAARADRMQNERWLRWLGWSGLALMGTLLLALGWLFALWLRNLLHASRSDSLTGVGNRKALETQTKELLRHPKLQHHAVVILEMDRFKAVNDTFGYEFGDVLLEIVADGLCDIALRMHRKSHSVVRLGGDEFFMSLHNDQPIDGIEVASSLDRLRAVVIGTPIGTFVHPEFSYGIVHGAGDPELAPMMHAADRKVSLEKARRRQLADIDQT